MISFDANLMLYAINTASPFHTASRAFIESLIPRTDVCVSELLLVEFYSLLRNPSVLATPLPPSEAVAVIQTYRHHPRWALIGFGTENHKLHEELWRFAAEASYARRQIYDTRLALTLRQQGVTEFATATVKDFQGFGFLRVWNPLDLTTLS